jgi:hypothetical protein
MANTYVKRCRALIATYKWKKDDEDDNTLKTLPYDIFDFLKLKFAPLESFTSDEIIKIAHYLKASELVTTPNYDDEYPGTSWRSYGELIEKYTTRKWGYDYIVNSVTGCGCGKDDCDENYADVVTPLKNIDLDT